MIDNPSISIKIGHGNSLKPQTNLYYFWCYYFVFCGSVAQEISVTNLYTKWVDYLALINRRFIGIFLFLGIFCSQNAS